MRRGSLELVEFNVCQSTGDRFLFRPAEVLMDEWDLSNQFQQDRALLYFTNWFHCYEAVQMINDHKI